MCVCVCVCVASCVVRVFVRWLCVCVESECGVSAESVCGMCVFVFWCCGVLCCVVMCGVGAGVGAQCVVCGVCGVCAWCLWCVCCVCCVLGVCGVVCVCCLCVARLGTRKTPLVSNMRAFCQYTRRRFEPTHRDVFNLHTERRKWGRKGRRGSLLSLSLPFSLCLFRRSLSLLSFSSRSCRLSSPLSATMTMITRPVGLSLCTQGSDLPECQSACTLAHSVFGRTSSYHTTVQASCHLE